MYSTNKHLFLVVFHAVSDKFIMCPDELGEVIRKYNKYGIESIKLFDPVKEKFVRVGKERIAQLVSDTDSILQLQKINFIKA